MTKTFLDWRRHRIGPMRPCVHCGRPALCRDEHDRPCHKICAEAAHKATTTPAQLDLSGWETPAA